MHRRSVNFIFLLWTHNLDIFKAKLFGFLWTRGTFILLQYLVIFEINKSNIVLPIIEDLEDKIVHYGFFRSADPENPRLLCKDPELLITYGMDKVGYVYTYYMKKRKLFKRFNFKRGLR